LKASRCVHCLLFLKLWRWCESDRNIVTAAISDCIIVVDTEEKSPGLRAMKRCPGADKEKG
jgi:hypothetical protein